jgi:rhombotail lipoprotein
VDNLKIQLADFRERVTNAPTEYKIQYKPGYTGAGAFNGTTTALVVGIGAYFLWMRRHRRV